MQYEQFKWYEWTFQPKNIATLKEWMLDYAGETVRVQAGWIIEDWDFEWQHALILEKMFWDICCWIPEEDFIPNEK